MFGIRSTADRPASTPADAILVNVVWIVDQFDGRALEELGKLPILELAKHVSIESKRSAA
jgi:hypothetical protein